MRWHYVILIMILAFVCFCTNKPNPIQKQITETGISELKFVFEPGLRVGNETVAKTFQPSYVVTQKGTLLVFCQGRLMHGDDNEPKVILMNKSYDYGNTWEGVTVLSAPMNHFAISPWVSEIENGERISFLTCVGLKVTKAYYDNDPKLVLEKTGIDLNAIGMDKASVLLQYWSDDDGVTWHHKVLTGTETPLYQNYNGHIPVFLNTIGQVHAIKQGPNKGRLILAAPVYSVPEGEAMTDNFRNHPCSGSGVLYSDDQGESWKMDGFITDYLGNEASAVSIDDGKRLFMIRRVNSSERLARLSQNSTVIPQLDQRIAHTSEDGGASWSDPFLISVSSVLCHGTLARVGDRMYFSIPNGREQYNKVNWDDDRVHGTIYFSDDDGKTWQHKMIEEGPFSYSTVGKLADEYMITFFSRGGHGDKGIGYRIFSDMWLEKKNDEI